MRQLRYLLLSLILIGFAGSSAMGQLSQTQYFMNFPQSNMLNPAFRPANKVTVGIPALSNIYLGINNNILSINDILRPMEGADSTITILHPDYPKSDRDAFLKGLGNTSYLTFNASVQLFQLGFTIDNDWYVDLTLSQKATGSAYLPGDLFTLAFEGNESFVGSTIDLSGFGFEAMQYMETALGISKNINEKLRIGGRVKLLFGGVGAAIDNRELLIDVNNDLSHTIHSDVILNVSGPFTFVTDADNMVESVEVWDDINPFDILINSDNSGLAFDLGAEYQLLHNLSVSASIVDLGFLGWKTDVFNLSATNDFIFDGFDVSDVIEGNREFDEVLDSFADSLLESFELMSGSSNFSMGMPTRLYIGAQYKPLNYLGLGLLSRSIINEGHFSQALSLSANLYAGDILSTSLTYTMANRSYNNLGFGVSLKMGPVQFYTIADQLPLSWVKFESIEDDISFPMPNRLDFINVRFGINLLFGKVKQKVNDKPMLLE
ncbi:MAG: DUF5723 family protein [Marinilabiliaceae bacterium]|jgi:hypothetical protein|nr:DUF5723 family protein [Marinilabiliaceae bacterium]